MRSPNAILLRSPLRSSLVWSALLVTATVAGSMLTACGTPFVALGTLAALTMPRRIALLTVAAAWLANQLLGFGLLGYPLDGATIIIGIAMGLAALIATTVAGAVASTGRIPARPVSAQALAFVGQQLALFAIVTLVGAVCPFTPGIVAAVAINEVIWFVGLLALYVVLRQRAGGRRGRIAA